MSVVCLSVYRSIYLFMYTSFYVCISQVIVDPNVISIFRELPQADILVNSIYSCDYKKFFEGVGYCCLSSLSISLIPLYYYYIPCLSVWTTTVR